MPYWDVLVMHMLLTALKEYVAEGDNLIYPINDVMHMLKIYEEHFAGIN